MISGDPSKGLDWSLRSSRIGSDISVRRRQVRCQVGIGINIRIGTPRG